MQVNVTGHHIEITEALRDYVSDRLSRLQRHFEQVSTIHCILTVEKIRHRAEATIHITGAQLFADATEGDMYAAIDALADKLDSQVRRHKEKLTGHHDRHSVRRDLS